MAENLVQVRVDAIRRLTRRRAAGPLGRAIAKSPIEDVAEAVAHLTRGETLFLVDQIEDDVQAGELLYAVDDRDLLNILEGISTDRVSLWIAGIEPDDQADVLARVPEEIREKVLAHLEEEERENVEELMAWPPDSAGGIMSPVAFRLPEHITCREAIEALQEQRDVEMVFYLYVESETGQLVGVLSLRNLLINPPSTRLHEIMSPDVISVTAETDQEEVARIAARYDYLAVPVVDETHHLLGIVTIDDVIDVIREEAAEDLMKMAGVADTYDPHAVGVVHDMKTRVRWLLVTLVAGMLLVEIIAGFEQLLSKHLILAGFIPVIMGLSGNVGIQAATITIQAQAAGRMAVGQGVRTRILREGRVGVLLGLFFGSLILAWCVVRGQDVALGMAISVSISLALVVAAVLGTMTPIVLKRLNVDPAVAAGPFVTTVIDLLGILVYFGVVSAWPGL